MTPKTNFSNVSCQLRINNLIAKSLQFHSFTFLILQYKMNKFLTPQTVSEMRTVQAYIVRHISMIKSHLLFEKLDHTHNSGLFNHHLIFSLIFGDDLVSNIQTFEQ